MRLIILGAGGYGRTVADVAAQTGMYDKIRFLDDNSLAEDVIGKCADFSAYAGDNTIFYPAFGNNEGRVTWLKRDRKSTRLNSSHTVISYAVFCLKKKK